MIPNMGSCMYFGVESQTHCSGLGEYVEWLTPLRCFWSTELPTIIDINGGMVPIQKGTSHPIEFIVGRRDMKHDDNKRDQNRISSGLFTADERRRIEIIDRLMATYVESKCEDKEVWESLLASRGSLVNEVGIRLKARVAHLINEGY